MQIEKEDHKWEGCLCYIDGSDGFDNSDEGRGACRLGCDMRLMTTGVPKRAS